MVRNSATGIADYVSALKEAIELGEGRLDPDTLTQMRETIERAESRTSLSSENTVIGFFGATGSGKSTLFNAVVGKEVARTAVTRPTTSEALAAVWGQEDTEPVLDWLGVKHRVYMDHETQPSGPTSPWAKAKNFLKHRAPGTTGGLILLDLPDFDSIELTNRELVERMIKMVDVMVWVFDPQKYADAVIHQEFIAPLSAHGGVMMAVLNQVDRITERDTPMVLNSLQKQLDADGLADKMLAPPVAVSAKTGEGIDGLRTLLAGVAEKKNAALARVLTDLDSVHHTLTQHNGGGKAPSVSKEASNQLAQDLYTAAGGDAIVAAAGQSYKIRATSATGMVATRWMLKFKADPLKRLNLHRSEEEAELSRSSLPPLTPAQGAGLNSAVRAFGNRAAAQVTEPWASSIKDAAFSHTDQLPQTVEKAISTVDFRWSKNRWWWNLINVLQWFALLAAVVGLGWLLSYTLAGFFQIQLPPPPPVEGLPLPVPTALLLLAVLLALLLALTSRLVNSLGVKNYEKKMKRLLTQKIHTAIEPLVIEPTEKEISRLSAYNQSLATNKPEKHF